jgi:hypothetical protein
LADPMRQRAARIRFVLNGAAAGAALGSLTLNTILVRALSLHPIGGIGETHEWVSLLVTLWGLPLSWLAEVLVPRVGYGVVSSIMVINFAMWGAACSLLLHLILAKRRT